MSDSRPLTGLLSWEGVDALIEKVRSIGPWYIHAPAEGLPSVFSAAGDDAAQFLLERTEELKSRQRGAGWIYVHTPDAPTWIKIYDPAKCGSSCSTSTPPAWWEMNVDDPRHRLADEAVPQRKASFLGRWQKKSG